MEWSPEEWAELYEQVDSLFWRWAKREAYAIPAEDYHQEMWAGLIRRSKVDPNGLRELVEQNTPSYLARYASGNFGKAAQGRALRRESDYLEDGTEEGEGWDIPDAGTSWGDEVATAARLAGCRSVEAIALWTVDVERCLSRMTRTQKRIAEALLFERLTWSEIEKRGHARNTISRVSSLLSQA